jgi:hypothetical protein
VLYEEVHIRKLVAEENSDTKKQEYKCVLGLCSRFNSAGRASEFFGETDFNLVNDSEEVGWQYKEEVGDSKQACPGHSKWEEEDLDKSLVQKLQLYLIFDKYEERNEG